MSGCKFACLYVCLCNTTAIKQTLAKSNTTTEYISILNSGTKRTISCFYIFMCWVWILFIYAIGYLAFV